MKSLLLAVIACLFFLNVLAQGKYAGAMKNSIGKKFTDSRQIQGLAGWKYLQGTMITEMDDPEMMTAVVLKKGNTVIILFSSKEDSVSQDFFIEDILEIKNVKKNQQVKTATCKEGKEDRIEIVALVTVASKEYLPAIKAWRFNRDKRRIEFQSIKMFKCWNEGFDLP